ncbi:MAG TPA: MOSC domain-containing protein [Chthoniobacterales bacterium]|nr:MOSC domain-containing protein [Chthoniobacterales bacterium]
MISGAGSSSEAQFWPPQKKKLLRNAVALLLLSKESIQLRTLYQNDRKWPYGKDAVHIGDRLRVGSAEFVVSQPRMPCFKLGIWFGRPEIVKRFLRSGRTGFYLAVLQEGRVTAGDSMESLTRDEHGVTAAGIVKLYKADATNQELLRRASELPALPPFWQDYFRKRLWDPDS